MGLVEDVGTFAIRGSIIDIFWAGLPYPVRIDLFGDEIERLTPFFARKPTNLGNAARNPNRTGA